MKIDADTLERLLTDQAFGELPPDTEALLTAYLADRADERALADQITRTVSAAKAALTDPQPVQLPPFPASALADADVRGDLRLARLRKDEIRTFAAKAPLFARAAALAACVLMGIGVHALWTANAPSQPRGTNLAPVAVATIHSPPSQATAQPPHTGFWSARQWYERSEQNHSDHTQRVIWDSPLTRPRIGDAT